jgi:hypothetical protein
MSIREHFASVALQGMLSNPSMMGCEDEKLIKYSLKYSDMLLEALGR